MQTLIWNNLTQKISGWNWADDTAHGKCDIALEAAMGKSLISSAQSPEATQYSPVETMQDKQLVIYNLLCPYHNKSNMNG